MSRSSKSVSKKTRRNAKYSPRLATAREVFRKNGYKGEDNLSFEEFLELSPTPLLLLRRDLLDIRQ